MTRAADAMARHLWGRSPDEARATGTCVRCARPVGELAADDAREYELSALCPACWVDVMGEEEPE